jgi:hypothetical protein
MLMALNMKAIGSLEMLKDSEQKLFKIKQLLLGSGKKVNSLKGSALIQLETNILEHGKMENQRVKARKSGMMAENIKVYFFLENQSEKVLRLKMVLKLKGTGLEENFLKESLQRVFWNSKWRNLKRQKNIMLRKLKI